MTRSVPEWIGATDDAAIPPRVVACACCGMEFRLRRPSKPNACCSRSCAQRYRLGVRDLLDQYTVDPASECWIWTGATNGRGYGAVRLDGRIIGAHRASYERAYGPLLEGSVVRHVCDTALCINPAHLKAGSQADNVRDMDARGRRAPTAGERNGRHRFTDAEIEAVRHRLLNGERQVDVARDLGVRRSTIQNIGCGRSRVVASPREIVQPTDRRAMTAARRGRIISAHGGTCAYPECRATLGLEVDHVIALALGGPDTDENCRPLCGPHHLQKTALDRKLIAKADRLQAKARGIHPKSKAKIRSRGFDRSRPQPQATEASSDGR